MADALTLIAAVEWIVAGILFRRMVRKWDRAFCELYEQLKEEIANG